ncbi:MAG: iron ABC transporter permease [Anaerolineaceae bacterium]|nr:MAG: iron ABC transporter permease [Anaerolineaceae bacterium]
MTAYQIPRKPARDDRAETPAPDLRLGLRPLALIGLGLLAVVVFLFSLSLGSVNITLHDTLTVLLGGEPERASATRIIHNVRIPQAITAAFAGAALGVSGLLMQTFFRNPLAGPFVLGISSGASLGVALVILGTGAFSVPVIVGLGVRGDLVVAFASSVGAGLTMMAVLFVAGRVGNSLTLLILGVMFGYLTGAVVSLLLYFSVPQQVDAYVSWSFGTFGRVTTAQLHILIPAVVVGLGLAALLTKSLNALLLGEGYARSMGLNVRLVRWTVIAATGILAGVVTAFCGPVSFIGMAVPHLCRSLLNTSDHRMLLPACVLMGAAVAMLAGLIARVPGSHIILPLNAVTALIGAPVVVWVILKQNNLNRTFAR